MVQDVVLVREEECLVVEEEIAIKVAVSLGDLVMEEAVDVVEDVGEKDNAI